MDFTDDEFESKSELDQLVNLPQIRFLKVKHNPLDELSDNQTIDRFRFSKASIEYILNIIQDDLIGANSSKITDVSPIVQLLISLRFFATGTFQLTVGDLHQSSQPNISKIIKRVARAIAKLRSRFVVFSSNAEAVYQKLKFQNMKKFPGVVGAIDCTHLKIRSHGGEDAELYRNKIGYFSINMQCVCDADRLFTNVVARWPGLVYDSRIFDKSLIQDQLENREIPRLLLGDSGYPNLPYLLTPLEVCNSAAKRRYNNSHATTRNVIERAFGHPKRRFYCLGSDLRTKLKTSLAIAVACVVLHNFAKLRENQN